MIMNKKVYLQPQIKCAPLPMENLLASWSKPETESKTDPDNPPIGPGNGGLGGRMIWAPRSTLTTLIPGIPGIKNYQ